MHYTRPCYVKLFRKTPIGTTLLCSDSLILHVSNSFSALHFTALRWWQLAQSQKTSLSKALTLPQKVKSSWSHQHGRVPLNGSALVWGWVGVLEKATKILGQLLFVCFLNALASNGVSREEATSSKGAVELGTADFLGKWCFGPPLLKVLSFPKNLET